MKEASGFRRVLWPMLMAPVLIVYGLAPGGQEEAGPAEARGIAGRFERFEGPAREIPLERWKDYFADFPLTVSIRDGNVELGQDRFRSGVQEFLESTESGGAVFRYDVQRIWHIADRLAWVQGDLTVSPRREGSPRPFAEILVRSGGEWRALFSYVGSPGRAERTVAASRSGCSCRPCEDCSARE